MYSLNFKFMPQSKTHDNNFCTLHENENRNGVNCGSQKLLSNRNKLFKSLNFSLSTLVKAV